MSCNCKRKLNNTDENNSEKTLLDKLVDGFGSIIAGILSLTIIIIVLPLFLIFMFVNIITGNNITLNVTKISSFLKGKTNQDGGKKIQDKN